MSNCEVEISTCLRLEFPNIQWRLDALIPTPMLFLPIDGRAFCLEVQNGGSLICLEWFAVPGATHYLIEWSLEDQFTGPSVQEQIVLAPSTSYCLSFPQQIRQGETLYWRVQAANLFVGGVSNKSPVRKFTYNCGQDQNTVVANKCDQYNITALVKGRESLGCCELGTYWLEVSYDCQDPFGNPMVQLVDVTWSTTNAAVVVDIDIDNMFKTGIKTCTTETEVFEVNATLRFRDRFNNLFECEATPRAVIADCGSAIDKVFPVLLAERYRGEAKGALDVCGEEVFITEDCNPCKPCCKQFRIETFDTTGDFFDTSFEYVNYDPEECKLRYKVEVGIPGVATPAIRTIYEIFKGPGKSCLTTPTSETDDRWIFNIPALASIIIELEYDGCWKYADEPYFTILRTVDDASPTVTHRLGKYVVCLSEVEPEGTQVVTVGGPVYSVNEVRCSDEKWPVCTDNFPCECDFGRLEISLDQQRYFISNDGQKYRYDLDCGCDECIDGYFLVSMTQTEMDEGCTASTHTVLFELFCEDKKLNEETVELEFFCDSSEAQAVDIEYCGCTFFFRARSVEGVYTQGEKKPCDCIQEKVNVCIRLDDTTSCIVEIERKFGQWILPNNREVDIDDRRFVLQDLYFIGCDLYARVCEITLTCTASSPFDCVCGGVCSQSPENINISIDYEINGNIVGQQATTFSIDKQEKEYISGLISVPDPSGCNTTGRLIITSENTVVFEGTDSNGTPVLYQSDELAFDCVSGISGNIDVFTTCYINGSPAESALVTLVFNQGELWPECSICETDNIKLTVSNCLPLVASGSGELNGSPITVSIGGDVQTDDCGCIIPNAQEARINIPLGCGLKVEQDRFNINQKTIAVDIDSIVGRGKPDGYFETSVRGGCAHITLPICSCVGFDKINAGSEGTPDPTKIPKVIQSAYIYKSLNYNVKALETIGVGQEGSVEVLSYDRLNPGYRAVTTATNRTSSTIGIGQEVLMISTESCDQVLILNVGAPTTPSPEDDFNALPDCEGSCRYIWNNKLKKWVRSETETYSCSNRTTEAPTTSAATTLDPDCWVNPDENGTCVYTCLDEDGDGNAVWTFISPYDGCEDGYECNTTIIDQACTQIGVTTQQPCLLTPTTPVPVPSCVYECQFDNSDATYTWTAISNDCPDGMSCDDSLESTPCIVSAGVTTSIPCVDDEDCGCIPPQFCGTEDGQCTFTLCSTFSNNYPEPECDITTLPPGDDVLCCNEGVATVKTREDCCESNGYIVKSQKECDCWDDSENPPDISCGECEYIWTYDIQWRWVLTKGCDSVFCFCGPPSQPGAIVDPCSLASCAPITGTTPCIRVPDTECTGNCTFLWNCHLKVWFRIANTCPLGATSVINECSCNCNVPSEDGPDDRFICVRTPCFSDCVQPCPPFEDPCLPPADPDCDAPCLWEARAGSSGWNLIDPCSSGCMCQLPPREPIDDCEVYPSFCIDIPDPTTPPPGTTTTTTATPTTTTTTTTTTTAEPPPEGACCLGEPCFSSCGMFTEAGCGAAGGLWLGPDFTCDNAECGIANGACCIDGVCSVTTCSACLGAGGAWFGVGTTCTGDDLLIVCAPTEPLPEDPI